MDAVNKTLYIPLCAKARVSQKGIILHDPKAEEIWQKEGFPLTGKAASKWLAYYMAMRARVFDEWLEARLAQDRTASVLHIGCGMDGRVSRVAHGGHLWFDVDFPEVIALRNKHYPPMEGYEMIPSDARDTGYLQRIPGDTAIVVMEGVSMYLTLPQLRQLLGDISGRFSKTAILLDCYTTFAAKASRYKNPVNQVGVTTLYGLDDPKLLEGGELRFLGEQELTPRRLSDALPPFERWFFRSLFGGAFAKKLYRLYEFSSEKP